MATYKVIQDIEAEDKLIWALSFRQFVYALVAAIFLYFTYLFLIHGVFFMAIFTIPISLFSGFLAYPFGKDQPTEVWALAKLRFFIKPRQRIWAQSGIKQLVTITVPKKVEVSLTKNLSQAEVKSRLQALADTIDSRGWTVKTIDTTFQNPLSNTTSDRLLGTAASAPPADLANAVDILDVTANPIAQKMDQLLISEANHHRQELIDNLDKIRVDKVIKEDGASTPAAVSTGRDFAFSASTNADDDVNQNLKDKEKNRQMSLSRMRTFKASPEPRPATSATPSKDPDIINLSRRNDLNVDVLGHEINRARGIDTDSEDEVTISLH